MGDFSKKFNNYVHSPGAWSFKLNTHYPFKDSVNYIKFGIMSIFEGSNKNNMFNSRDGAIDYNEFNSVSKEEYEAQVKQMQEFYKQNTGKELAYHIPTYKELETMLKNDIEKPVRNAPLCKSAMKITEEELVEPIIPNGRIGHSTQEGSGECYQDATNMAMSYGKKGAQLLNRSIKPAMGGYQITLYGAKDKKGNKVPKTYYFSQEELKKAQEEHVNMRIPDGKGGFKTIHTKKYASGDADIVLLDLAIEKYRRQTNYKLRYQDTKAVKGYDDYLSGGFTHKNLELITGHSGYIECYQSINVISRSTNGEEQKVRVSKPVADRDAKIDKRLKYIAIRKENTISTCTFICSDNNWGNFKKYDLYEAHAYAIKSVDKKRGIVEISNPHEGRESIIKIPIDEFKKYAANIGFINV